MTPNEYQKLASRTECDQSRASASRLKIDEGRCGYEALTATRLNHAVLGLAGEVGELASAVEKWIHYGQYLDETNIKEELGDCLWYIALACNALQMDLNGVLTANISKLKKRYPKKYTDECAKEENRDRKAEAEAIKLPDVSLEGSKKPIQMTPIQLTPITQDFEIKKSDLESLPNKNKVCKQCKTPFSDRAPKYCPECGAEQNG